jgi:hypothetical protein
MNLPLSSGVLGRVIVLNFGERQMKLYALPAAFAMLVTTGWVVAPAHAAGCLKGAAVGGVAGHFAGHHGALGAGAGCLIGHHEANKNAREKAQQQGSSSGNQADTHSGH